MIPATAKSSSFSSSVDTFIIFECSDLRRDTGLFLLKQKKDNTNKFELHLHNDYTNQAISMILDIKDLARMFEALNYFQQREREQIQQQEI